MAGGEMRIHYNNALRPESNIVPACGLGRTEHGRHRVRATVNIDLVTCRRCLKVLRRTIHS